MKKLVESIVNKHFDSANSIIKEAFDIIVEQKMVEKKKMMMAEKNAWNGMPSSRQEKLYRDVLEEDELEEMDVSKEKPETEDIIDVRPTQKPVQSGKGDKQKTDNETVVPKNNLKEEQMVAGGKMNSVPYNRASTTFINNTIKNQRNAVAPEGSNVGSSMQRDDMTPQERMRANKTQAINNTLKTAAPREGQIDARTNKPYVAPQAQQMPLRGPTTQGSSQVNQAGKGDRIRPASPVMTNRAQNTTVVQKVNEEEETLDEARIKIVKARIRGGKIQRRKKVSNIPGMTLRGGQLKRMSAAERRRRKLGQRKGKLKRKAKMARTLMKRRRSIQKRKTLGL